MKICITSDGKNLDSNVDPRFGRCKNFIFLDTETGEFEAADNEHAAFQGGAGIQSAQFAASKAAKAVITGNIGPNAFQTLKAAGIEVFAGVQGKVSDAAQSFKQGKFKATQDASVGSKFGIGK